MIRGYNPNIHHNNQGYPPSLYHTQQPQQQPYHPQQQHQQQQQQQQHQQPQSMLNGQHGQPQSQQQQGNGAPSTDAQSQAASGGQGGQEMNLASVLHYLQSEWRRWERDRNEWEIERAEMRARIALLEGQRRSAENLKVDLLRRVKMLEFALRQERTKTVNTAGKAGTLAPSRLAALQDEDRASVKEEKEGSMSEGSEEGSSDRPKVNGSGSNKPVQTVSGRAMPDTSAWKSIGGVPPRDPKSRARSREYLKQCLQEITYLTSPGALNPLPPRPPISVTDPVLSGDHLGDLQRPENIERPRKAIPDDLPPSQFASKPETKTESQDETASKPQVEANSTRPTDSDSAVKTVEVEAKGDRQADSRPTLPSHARVAESSGRPPSSPLVRTASLPDTETNGHPQTDSDVKDVKSEDQSDEHAGTGAQMLTAIYRPESAAAWRAELKAANEKATKIKAAKSTTSDSGDTDELAALSLSAEDEEVKGEPSDASERVWTTRRSLKSHLDIVRSVSFAHGPGVMLASGGDDNTVKVWSVEQSSVLQRRTGAKEIEPIATYRGHIAPVTSVVVSSSLNSIFSGSMDTTIRVWKLPASNQDPYGPYDPSTAIQTLEGHTDIVWDLTLLPPTDSAGKNAKEKRLVSASADGTIKVWTLEDGKWSLKASYSFEGAVPTCLAQYSHDFSKVLVGLTNGLVKLKDVETGEDVMSFGEVLEDAQPNAILSHPTLPAIISAHEDGHLRFFDAKTSSTSPSHTILAHPGAVTSLALSPLSPTSVLTASVDCTVRLWDLAKKTSLQEFAGHRKRSDEGVCAVASHPDLPIVASAGADGVVRLWSTA